MPSSGARKVLGLANTGCYSHQMLIRKVGEELLVRGHEFAMLVSDVDVVGVEALAGVKGMQIIRFAGPPNIGTEAWAASLPQDPVEVHFSLILDHLEVPDECFCSRYSSLPGNTVPNHTQLSTLKRTGSLTMLCPKCRV